jgi:predicted acylesterase/phospholipase RssA
MFRYDSLILSGGGSKGICTLGALQYLQDKKFLDNNDINYYIGSSVGSIICYLLIIGYTPIEIVVYLCSNNVLESFINKTNNFSLSLLTGGLYDYSIITEHFEKMTLLKIDYIPTLKQLKDNFGKELIVCSYNLTDHKREYINWLNYPDLSCLDSLRMSSNIPFFFNEFIYNGKEYIDGGIVDNFPIGLLVDDKFKNKKILGINLDDRLDNVIEIDDKSNYYKVIKLLNKLYNIVTIPLKEKKKYDVDVDIIKIDVDNLKIYNFSLSHSRKLELFSHGYNYAKHYFDNKILEDSRIFREFEINNI